MVLTQQRCPRNPDAFPTLQLFLLAVVRLAEPVALTSIFPYAWSLVRHFQVGNERDASFYAGLLISAFSLTEALMGMYWGGLSDRIGRKPVLVLGCLGTMLSMIVVGFATNIWIALFGRAFGGLLNGNIGVIQTMVGEIVTKPEHEREWKDAHLIEKPETDFAARAFAVMPFVWSIGTIVGPAIGGIFADPNHTWPEIFGQDSWFTIFPYLLPNVICASLLFVSILLACTLLEETHPDMQPRVMLPDDTYATDETPLLETSDALKQPPVDLRSETYGSFRAGGSLELGSEAARRKFGKREHTSIFNKHTMALIVSLSIFTYHSMTYDHLTPIFFEDKKAHLNNLLTTAFNPFYSPGGLGLSMQTVGVILAVNGAIALFVQVVVFPLAAEKIGIFRLFLFVTLLHPIAYIIVPCLVYVPESILFPAIYFCLTIRNLLSIVLYPLLLILIKEATPSPHMLGKVNGLAASAGAACRMIAPPVAGYLYAFGSQADCTAIAWYGSAFVAAIGSIQCLFVQRDRRESVSKEPYSVERV